MPEKNLASHLPNFEHINEATLWAIESCRDGTPASPRGEPTLEVFACSFKLSNPRNRVLSLANRKWNHALAVGELCWHMAGRDDVEALTYYAPRWLQYSEDGRTVRGSCYGKKMFASRNGVNAWEVAANFLRDDPDSRRATITVGGYDTSITSGVKDMSCLQTLHFLIRDNKLNLICHMRSNDSYIGLPYDVFLFSFFMEIMAFDLGYEIGDYIHIADSMHLYERDWNSAQQLRTKKASAPMHRVSDREGMLRLIDFEDQLRTKGVAAELPRTQPWTDMANVLMQFHSKQSATPFA